MRILENKRPLTCSRSSEQRYDEHTTLSQSNFGITEQAHRHKANSHNTMMPNHRTIEKHATKVTLDEATKRKNSTNTHPQPR